MRTYFCDLVFLQSGWAKKARIRVNDIGTITTVELAQTYQSDDIHITGPVVPGIPNCHSHAFQRAFAGLAETKSAHKDSFWTWRQLMYQFLQQLSPDDCLVIAKQLYMEMLLSGYTSVGEFHYLHHDQKGDSFANKTEMSDQLIRAADEVGIKLTLLPVLYQYSGFGQQLVTTGQQRFTMSTADYIQLYEQLLTKRIPHHLNVGVAPHSLRAVDLVDLKQLTDAVDSSTCCHIHIAEQIAEVQQAIEFCGQRPVDYLLDAIDVDERWTLIHATHITEHEISKLNSSAAVLGICPTTEASLGDGIINPTVFSDSYDIPWAIGSDSHISVDAIEELRWLEYGQRLISQQRNVITDTKHRSNGTSLWSKAVTGGAKSIGHGGEIGIGQQADWLVLEANHPSLVAQDQQYILDALIFSNRGSKPIKDVYVNGYKVIDNQKHEQQEAITADYQKLMSRLILAL